MSKILSLHHIVFGTKQRVPAIEPFERENLCRFIWSLLKEENCYLYRVNCVADHIHILIDLNPTKSLSAIVGTIKSKSSYWMKHSGKFPLFNGWCEGFYASSVSRDERDTIIDYIKEQQNHHANGGYEDEMIFLYKKNGLVWHDKDLL